MATLVCERRCRSLRSPATSLGNEASGVRGGAVPHRSPSLCAPFSLLTCKGARHEAPPAASWWCSLSWRPPQQHRHRLGQAGVRERPAEQTTSSRRQRGQMSQRGMPAGGVGELLDIGRRRGMRVREQAPATSRSSSRLRSAPDAPQLLGATRPSQGRGPCSSRSFGTTVSRAPPSIYNVFHPRPDCVVRDSL